MITNEELNKLDWQKNKKLLILVDFSNFLYRAYFSSIKDLEIRPWMPFIRGLDMLRACVKYCRKEYEDVEFIFAGDSYRHKLERTQIDPEYKAHRKSVPDQRFNKFRNLLEDVLQHMGFSLCMNERAEGDDVIATCVHNNMPRCDCNKRCANCACEKSLGTRIVIFSADKDLYALLSYKNVTVYRPPNIIYSKNDFLEEYGFDPSWFPIYKALIGDKSDNIKGVMGWGEAKAKKHIIVGDWEKLLNEENKMSEFKHSMSLVKLNYKVSDVPLVGTKINIANNNLGLYTAVMREYQNKEAVDDIIFGEKRLELELR